jgi:hypothetical protein
MATSLPKGSPDRVAAGIDPTGFSGHSLRAGFATSAVQAGASTVKIRSQTGHASDIMLARYIRDGEIFVGNAGGASLIFCRPLRRQTPAAQMSERRSARRVDGQYQCADTLAHARGRRGRGFPSRGCR